MPPSCLFPLTTTTSSISLSPPPPFLLHLYKQTINKNPPPPHSLLTSLISSSPSSLSLSLSHTRTHQPLHSDCSVTTHSSIMVLKDRKNKKHCSTGYNILTYLPTVTPFFQQSVSYQLLNHCKSPRLTLPVPYLLPPCPPSLQRCIQSFSLVFAEASVMMS